MAHAALFVVTNPRVACACAQERYTPLLVAACPRRVTADAMAILQLLLEAGAAPGAQARVRCPFS
jgi:hypothetical protein